MQLAFLLNSEKIWKLWKKSKLNSEKIWKIQKKIMERNGKYGSNLLFFCIFPIFSLFNLLFFCIFPIFSLFNLLFFCIFPILKNIEEREVE
jgi:hypothetical protein